MSVRRTQVVFLVSVLLSSASLTPALLGQISNDPLLRMPGTQPNQGIVLESPSSCLNCHADYDPAVEPGNWKGSMMAHSARDPLFWSAMAVAGQDSLWAFGNTNAVDLCFRCHTPGGWLAGRSDPPNGSLLMDHDFDGVQCDMCHRMWDPFFETTYDGSREGNDWQNYWDEVAGGISQGEADITYFEDDFAADDIKLFTGANFFDASNLPVYSTFTENATGQYFVSPNFDKRGPFADPAAPHAWLYSRYHKSKYFCSTCHDVSNPVLANMGGSGLTDQSGGVDQITEQYSAHRYYHVERTFSEFMLSAYGQQGGAATNPEFRQAGGPEHVSSCQDCHMQSSPGKGCFFDFAPDRPTDSTEHPHSAIANHDLSGGNTWMTQILASLDPSSPNFDPINVTILDKGPAVLTLNLDVGISPKSNGAALLDGSERAHRQLRLAATIKDLDYDPLTGDLSFKLQNNTGHKLITGYPEGRRMFVNVKVYSSGTLVHEINPYSEVVGTLKGLPYYGDSPPLDPNEVFSDELVYEKITSSTITGETRTLHFLLGTDRFKDNRIPPKGFNIAAAPERLSEPAWNGTIDPAYFSANEYANGYDQVDLSVPAGANFVRVAVYYQGTTREYIDFLRHEINGTGGTLPPTAYVIQTDPFFNQLKAWGDTIWDLWFHNHGLDGSGVKVPGIIPVEMTKETWSPVSRPRMRSLK